MKPVYRVPATLEYRWSAQELAALTDANVTERQASVVRVIDANAQAYETAKREQKQSARELRQQPPRAAMPSDLVRSVQRPPDLQAEWQKLLKHRRVAQRQIQEQQARELTREERKFKRRQGQIVKKRETFLDRMWRGRYNAMLRREREVRNLIRRFAAAHDITLTERHADALLHELLRELEPRIGDVQVAVNDSAPPGARSDDDDGTTTID